MRVRKALALTCCLLGMLSPAAQDKLPLTLESIFTSGDFDHRLPQNIRWHGDSKRFTYTETNPATEPHPGTRHP